MEEKEIKESLRETSLASTRKHEDDERKREEYKFRKTPQKDKAKKIARQFLNAWITDKSSDINRNSYSGNVDFHAKKTLFENVRLHGYKIISCEEIDGNKVGIHVDMTLDIRGKIRKKRILIYAVKIKNEWKIDMKSLLPS